MKVEHNILINAVWNNPAVLINKHIAKRKLKLLKRVDFDDEGLEWYDEVDGSVELHTLYGFVLRVKNREIINISMPSCMRVADIMEGLHEISKLLVISNQKYRFDFVVSNGYLLRIYLTGNKVSYGLQRLNYKTMHGTYRDFKGTEREIERTDQG